MISQDRGETWTEPIRVAKALPGFVSDPDDGFPLRTGDIIPEIAAGPNGSVYMVWQEATRRLAPRSPSRRHRTAGSPGGRRPSSSGTTRSSGSTTRTR